MDLLQLPKSDKRSSESQYLSVPEKEQQQKEKETCQIPRHLLSQEEVAETAKKTRNKILGNGRFKWHEQFRSVIDVQVLETNFEWMRVMLHYGNFILEILVIFTEIEERVFEEGDSRSGSFGVVRFLSFQGVRYAVKGIKFSYKDGDIDTTSVYKQYFLTCMAGIIEIGPEVLPLFGYDILLTKNMAFFSMEECQSTKLQSEVLESELVSNLKSMHALKLIHSDIKPDNMAYSARIGKHVFIDFGLSKLIEQVPGEKTKTKFCGTLSYCSEEMKKCYIFQMLKFVDLYGNDLCCLQNTVKSFAHLLVVSNFFKNKQGMKNQDVDRLSIFQQVIKVLRLKYFIRAQNKVKILEIIRKLKSKKIICQILSSPDIPKIVSEDKNIKDTCEMIKNSLFGRRSQIDSVDSLLCELFSEERMVMSAEKIVPISQILSSEPGFFDRYLVKPELILKLFHFFDPFSDCLHEIQNKWRLKRRIVEKIYELKGAGLKNPVFFCQKVRFALLYFRQKLKHLKNLRVMLSLRLLFLSLQLWRVVEELQNEIIEIIDDQFLKILKILEFSLFRSFFLWDFRRSNQRWIDQIMRLPLNFASLKEQAMKVLQIISSLRCSSSFQEELIRHKQLFMQELTSATRECPEAFEKQSIRNIRYFYAHLCKKLSPTPHESGLKGIEMKIYSRCWDQNSIEYTSYEDQQVKLFWPLKFQLETYIRSYQYKNLLEILIGNQFQTLKSRNESLPCFLFQMLLLRNFKKETLKFFKEKIQQLIQSKEQIICSKEELISSSEETKDRDTDSDISSDKVEENDSDRDRDSDRDSDKDVDKVSLNEFREAITQFDVEEIITSLNMFVEFMQRNEILAYTKERINKQTKILLIKDLSRTFDHFVQGQQVKHILNKSFYVRTDTLITQTKLKLLLEPNPDSLKPSIQSLSTVLQPFPSNHPNLISNFLTLQTPFQQNLHQPQPHFCKTLLLSITEQYIKQRQFHIFLTLDRIPVDYVRINNEEGRVRRNLEFLGQMMEEYGARGWDTFVGWRNMEIFYNVLERFCCSLAPLGPDIVVKVYKLARSSKKEWCCGLHAYFVFQLFLWAKPYLPESQQLQQITATTLRLESMPNLYRIKTLLKLTKLFKNLAPVLKSKRKTFLCERLQVRSTLQNKPTQEFMRRLGHRVQMIHCRKNRDIVVERLTEKVKGFWK